MRTLYRERRCDSSSRIVNNSRADKLVKGRCAKEIELKLAFPLLLLESVLTKGALFEKLDFEEELLELSERELRLALSELLFP